MASNNFSLPPPPMFVGENYNLWAAKMKSYLKAHSLWKVVLDGCNLAPLPDNPTVNQIMFYHEKW